MIVNQLVAFFLNDTQKKLAITFFIVAAILFIVQISQLFQSNEKIPAIPILALHSAKSIIDSPSLFKMPLFGEFTEGSETNITPSTLSVTIVGILYSPLDNNSQVIIKSGNSEQVYRLGDSLIEDAVIKQIKPDGIVVFYHGHLESLDLPKMSLSFDKPLPPLGEE